MDGMRKCADTGYGWQVYSRVDSEEHTGCGVGRSFLKKRKAWIVKRLAEVGGLSYGHLEQHRVEHLQEN
jgi:hypothetical protein